MCAPVAVTAWSPAHTTCRSTTTTTRLVRCISASCATRKEAKKRLALKPGSEYHYPRQTLKSGDTYLHTVPKYYPHLYGEKEGGGTQVLVLTGVPYENLDLPKLDDLSTGARSENIQHTLYKGMMLPLAVLAGLTVLVRRNTKNDHHDGGDDHES